MHIADSFVPTAAHVGILSMVTYFFMLVAMYSFLAELFSRWPPTTRLSPSTASRG